MIEQKVKKSKNIFKRIPWYGWVGAIIFIALHIILYKIAEIILNENWAFIPKIPIIDDAIPYTPYFFVEIYFLAYLFWCIIPIIVSTGKKENFINFMIFSILAYVISFIWLALMPTYMNRIDDEDLLRKIEEIKTPVTKWLAAFILKMDGNANKSWNLCPSYHCLSSALCAFGLIKQKQHKVATRVSGYAMAFLICCSTVLVKQHYFIDIVGGVGVAALSYLPIKLFKVGEKIVINHPSFLRSKLDVVKTKKTKQITSTKSKKK